MNGIKSKLKRIKKGGRNMIKVVRENKWIIGFLLLAILICFLSYWVFNSVIPLSIGSSLSGSLVTFMVIDLTLRRRKKAELKPKRTAADNQISSFVMNVNSLFCSMTKGVDEEADLPDSPEDLYTEDIAKKLSNLDLTNDAPTPKEELNWGHYLITELERLSSKADRLDLKYSDYLPAKITTALEDKLAKESLGKIQSIIVLILHEHDEKEGEKNRKVTFNYQLFKRYYTGIGEVIADIEDYLAKKEHVSKARICVDRGEDLRPWLHESLLND